MAKKVKAVLKLQLEAGKATPAPPTGPALGQHGVNIMAFCKEYNERTSAQEGVIPAEITIFDDRSYSFVTKTAPAAQLLKKAAGIEKGSATSGTLTAARLTRDKVTDIARAKMKELNANDLEGAVKIISGTARSMGIEVE